MTRLILMLALALAVPTAVPEVAVAQTQVEQISETLEKCREAAVRVRNRGSVGSGAFFYREGGNYYVLTNNHVAGREGNTVTIEMWYRGYLSQPIRGRVVFSTNIRNYYRDIAIIEIPESSLMGYQPPCIPLAPSDYRADYSRIYSFGCGAGSWLTCWEGHAFSEEAQSGHVINFHPQPAGGRSGSSIFSHDGKYIIGLIAWRSAGGQHNLDGGSENRSRHGIAMTKDEVRAALKGLPPGQVRVPTFPLRLPAYT